MLIAKPDGPVESLPELIQGLEARVGQFAEANKDEIIFPGHEQGFTRLLVSLGSLVGSLLCWLAFFFSGVFTDSDAVRFGFVGVALLLGLYNRIDDRREKKRVKRYNEGARIGLGATVMFATALLEPGHTEAEFGLAIMTTDRGLQADADRLARMADHLYALGHEGLEPIPEHLTEAVERLRGDRVDHQKWILLPREFTGNDETWLVAVLFYPELLPRGCVDRTLWPVLYHQDDRDVGLMVPDRELWWEPRVDRFMEVWEDTPPEGSEELVEAGEVASS